VSGRLAAVGILLVLPACADGPVAGGSCDREDARACDVSGGFLACSGGTWTEWEPDTGDGVCTCHGTEVTCMTPD
jgi:hypothetical protein